MPKGKQEEPKVIELIDGYVCVVDQVCWTLARRAKKKNGENYFQNISYHNSLESVFKALGRRMSVDALKSGSQTIPQAIQTISESNSRLEKLIEDSFPEFEVRKKV